MNLSHLSDGLSWAALATSAYVLGTRAVLGRDAAIERVPELVCWACPGLAVLGYLVGLLS